MNIGSSDWVLIITTLLLAAVAFLAPYVIERWKHSFFSPSLKITYIHEPPFSHITQMRGSGMSYDVYYFRFGVENIGLSQADECNAVLEKIWEEDSAGNLVEYRNFSPVVLKWSGIGLRNLTIQPQRKLYCDMGHISHPNQNERSVYMGIKQEDINKNKLFFEVFERFHAQWDCLVPGNYQIEATVYSRNAKKVSKIFKIAWSGNWKGNESDMFKEIVIS